MTPSAGTTSVTRQTRPRFAVPESANQAGGAPVPAYATAHAAFTHRLLVVSHHFPPDPAAGGLRWHKLAFQAAVRGWGLDVIALHASELSVHDAERLEDLPGGVRVYGVPLSPARLGRVLEALWRRAGEWTGALPVRRLRYFVRVCQRWHDQVRGNRWSENAAELVRRIAEPGVHRAVISCGPASFVHVVARRVAREAGLPYVMELEDPRRFMAQARALFRAIERLTGAPPPPPPPAATRSRQRLTVSRAEARAVLADHARPLTS